MARSDLIFWIALMYSCSKYAELCSVERWKECENYTLLSEMRFYAFIPVKNFNEFCNSLLTVVDCVYKKTELDKCPLEIRFPFDTQKGVIQAVCATRRQEYVSSGPCLQQDSLNSRITLEYSTAILRKETDICRTLDQLPDSVRNIVLMTDGCSQGAANLMADLMRLYLVPSRQKAACDQKLTTTGDNSKYYQKQESFKQEQTRVHKKELTPAYQPVGVRAENKDNDQTDDIFVERQTDQSRLQTNAGQTVEVEKNLTEKNPRLTSAPTTDMTWADQGESSTVADHSVSSTRSHGGNMEAQFRSLTSIRPQETSPLSADQTHTLEEARILIEETPIVRVFVDPTKDTSGKINFSNTGSDLFSQPSTQETSRSKVKASAMRSTQSNSATGLLTVNLQCLIVCFLAKAFMDSVTKSVLV